MTQKTCPVCDEIFIARRAYCSRKCLNRADYLKRFQPKLNGTCLTCGAVFVGSKAGQVYCSTTCQQKDATRRRPKRPKVEGTCPICGTTFMGTARRMYCGKTCSRKAHEANPARPKCIECDRPAIARERCRSHWNALRRQERGRENEAWNDRARAAYHQRRARKKNPDGRIEQITTADVAVRDREMCGICSTAVDMTLIYPDPGSPSLDHVIPLSRGGEHTWENVQLAHLGCNWKKHAKVA